MNVPYVGRLARKLSAKTEDDEGLMDQDGVQFNGI